MEADDDLRWLIALISDTGMRLSEAAGLHVDDIVLGEVPYVSNCDASSLNSGLKVGLVRFFIGSPN
jgi:hypothetical protein